MNLDYKYEQVIGKGTFGIVYLVSDKKSGKNLAVKKVPKEHIRMEEIRAGLILHHSRIPKMIKHYQDQHYFYLIMQYIENGIDLYRILEKRKFQPFDETTAKKIFRGIVKALRHSHQKGIVHRDLKLENILVNLEPKIKVYLIDFGLCAFVGINEKVTGKVGSFEYVAPEVLTDDIYNGKKADIYSLGVILYILLFANFPFENQERIDAVQQNKSHPEVRFPSGDDNKNLSNQKSISNLVKDLIKKMMTINPNERISIEEVLQHKWLKKDFLKSLSHLNLW